MSEELEQSILRILNRSYMNVLSSFLIREIISEIRQALSEESTYLQKD